MRSIKEFWRVYSRNKLASLGLLVLSFIVAIALLAPVISPYDPFEMFPGSLAAPSPEHLMGTDNVGRDILSRIIWASRVSLLVGFCTTAISTIVGILIGAFSGYLGGKIDEILMRITEIFMIIPTLLLAIVLVTIWGRSIWTVIFVLGLTCWPRISRLVRADFLSLKEVEFTEAAKGMGLSDLEIIFSEILPNALPPVIIFSTFQTGQYILLEAALGFLGLGDPGLPSWGYMISVGQQFIAKAWWNSFFPGLAIFILVLALNFIGDGLNIALNPVLREK